MKLWEGCFTHGAGGGNRFTYTKQVPCKGGVRNELVRYDPKTIDDHGRQFWLENDQRWAWYCFMIGCEIDFILEHVGGSREEFGVWVRSMCDGQGRSIFCGEIKGDWTPRQDKLLRRMRSSPIPFLEACRLLGRKPEEVKARWNIIKDLPHG